MEEVQVTPAPLARLVPLLAEGRADSLAEHARRTAGLLTGRTVWNVNSTARGGGVAEMLQTLLAYGRGAGVSTRWLVLDGTAPFYAVTKRIHNLLHGTLGDGGRLGHDERSLYESVLAQNLESLRGVVRPGDIVLLHDPQTAGLVEGVQQLGAYAVWRCHIGLDTVNELTELGWSFLRDFVTRADAFIFSRAAFAPDWVPEQRLYIIPPSLDPFSAKNAPLDERDVLAVVDRVGLVDIPSDPGHVVFTRRDGSLGTIRGHTDLVLDGGALPQDARIVLQVSRWDRLKDMKGVMSAFAEHVQDLPDDAHLLLVGPEVSGVSDDPEGAQVLEECRSLWRGLPPSTQARVHLCCLPMDDVDENAVLVNALQRYASVVVQKSLAEGFGLTVTEPMWKAKPVVASAVGGIRDQIVDRVSGRLLEDPRDHAELARALFEILDDPGSAAALGEAARERVRDQFLGDRHLIQYAELFEGLIEGSSPGDTSAAASQT